MQDCQANQIISPGADRLKAEHLMAKALEQAADAIVITDSTGKIQYVNPAFTRMTGYSAEEAVGQKTNILKSGSQSPQYYEDLWMTIRAGRPWHGELINRRKDGTLYTEEMTITPVRDSGGEHTGYIAIKQDVTDRRAADEARRFLEIGRASCRERGQTSV